MEALEKLSSKLSTSDSLKDMADRFSLWLDRTHSYDEEIRFVFDGGDVERYIPEGTAQPQGYYTKKLRYCTEEFDAPTTSPGQVASETKLHVKLMKDPHKGED